MLRTCVNMRPDILLTLNAAALRLGKRRREVIVMLLKRVMHDVHQFQGGFTLVKYQARDPEKKWRPVTVTFKKNENEYFSDLRKLCKCSLSNLIAIATERYLDDSTPDTGSRHNYAEFNHYAIGQRTEHGIICWELYWGDPAKAPDARAGSIIHRRTGTSREN